MEPPHQEAKKKCPYCAEEILCEAVKCRYCGEWLARKPASAYSNAQPVWHLVVLSIVTLNLYQIPWFYRNWKLIQRDKDSGARPRWQCGPLWKTVGLFIPLLGGVLVYKQLRDIRAVAAEAGCSTYSSAGAMAIVWSVLTAFWIRSAPFYCLALLSVWPLAVVQGVLNRYWKKEQPGLLERTEWSGRQKALLVVSGIIWALTMIK